MKIALIAVVFLVLGAAGAGTYVSVMNKKAAESRLESANEKTADQGESGAVVEEEVAVSGTVAVSPSQKTGAAAAAKVAVVVNGVKLTDVQIAALEKKYSTPIAGGNYWYDNKSGAWGKVGGPTEGYLEPGETIGGSLQSNASGSGATGVFVNGRELHPTDVKNLNTLFAAFGTATAPGRYWVDGQGNFGLEGQSASLGNLLLMVQAVSKKSGGNSFYYKSNGSDYTTFGGGGGFSYFGSKNDYNGSSSVFVDENGSVNIDYQPKSSDYSSDY